MRSRRWNQLNSWKCSRWIGSNAIEATFKFWSRNIHLRPKTFDAKSAIIFHFDCNKVLISKYFFLISWFITFPTIVTVTNALWISVSFREWFHTIFFKFDSFGFIFRVELFVFIDNQVILSNIYEFWANDFLYKRSFQSPSGCD